VTTRAKDALSAGGVIPLKPFYAGSGTVPAGWKMMAMPQGPADAAREADDSMKKPSRRNCARRRAAGCCASRQLVLESWSQPHAVGQPRPRWPLWLADALVIPLDLDQGYEQACRDLRIA
jgi:hypothetical protein